MTRVRFAAPARREFLHEVAFYNGKEPGLGARFTEEVERVIEPVLGRPELGLRMDENLRHFVLRRFPFSVVYAVIDDWVYIVALANGSREPNYWRLRVQDC